jgi:hypothetical protein
MASGETIAERPEAAARLAAGPVVAAVEAWATGSTSGEAVIYGGSCAPSHAEHPSKEVLDSVRLLQD